MLSYRSDPAGAKRVSGFNLFSRADGERVHAHLVDSIRTNVDALVSLLALNGLRLGATGADIDRPWIGTRASDADNPS